MSSEEFKHESLQDVRSIGKYLHAIADGLEQGEIEFSDDDDRLLLKPYGLLGLDVRAKRKGSKVRLSVRLSWAEESKKSRPDSLKVNVGDTEHA